MKRRISTDVVFAILLPLACAGTLLLVQPEREQPSAAPPVEAPLTSATLICPDALTDADPGVVGVTVLDDDAGDPVSGEVEVGRGEATSSLEVGSGTVSALIADQGPVVMRGTGKVALGLIAGRNQASPLAAVDCTPPAVEVWFTGVGAGPVHHSVIHLVNPNAGPATADILVRSPEGVLDVPALRGVSVPGWSAVDLDLAAIVPRRGELALQVEVPRGLLSAHVTEAHDPPGGEPGPREWLAGQVTPERELVLLGLVPGEGARSLILANPGEDEVRATVEIATPDSTFAPAELEPIRVPPGSTVSVSVSDVVAGALSEGAMGLVVEASGPVTAALRQSAGDDVALLAPAPVLTAASAVVVPRGGKRLLLAAPDAVGVATVTSFSAAGKPLDEQRVELLPGAGADLKLPGSATLVQVVPERTSVRATVLVTGAGATAISLRELPRTDLIPSVRPGIPLVSR